MTRRFALALTLVAPLALAACSTVSLPDTTPATAPAGWTNAAPAAAPTVVSPEWWSAYGSGELRDLVATALRNNPDLAASRHRIEAARARARAAGAGLLPSLGASGGGSRNWPGEGPARDSFRGALDVAYEVDLWGGERAAASGAETGALATRFDRDAAALSLSAEVASTYFQYLNLADRIANTREILAIAEQVLTLVERQEELGAASGLEVAQQRGAVASLRATLVALEQRRAETRNALAQLLGTTADRVTIRAASLDEVRLPEVTPGLPSELLTRRPDLRSAEAAIAGAEADVQAARAAMLPAIRLTAGSGASSAQLSSLFSPAGLLTNLASGLAAPIFDGGRLRANRDAAVSGQAQAMEQYRSAVIAAFRDVEDALAAATHLRDIEDAQRRAFEEAETAYGIAEARYRAGRTDFLALLDAQRTLSQQEDALEQTRLGRLNATAALYKALGGGWQG